MARQFDPSDSGYVDVAARIAVFREKFPDGCLQPADLTKPYEVVTIGGDTFVVVVAAAYRSADDQRPGIGMAYESYPGRTPYTKGSELQNAETSAWGRAIVAALAADTKRGIASAEDVRNRQAEQDGSWEDARPDRPQPGRDLAMERGRQVIVAAVDAAQLTEAQGKVVTLEANGTLSTEDAAELLALVHAREAELNGNPPPPAHGPSEVQHRHMHALWRELGLEGEANREERLTRTALVIGRDINSSKELNPAEADKVIDSLRRQAKDAKQNSGAAA